MTSLAPEPTQAAFDADAYRCPCPAKSNVAAGREEYRCTTCDKQFPVVRGVPVFIDDESSVFATCDYVEGSEYAGAGYGHDRGGPRAIYRRVFRGLADSGPRQAGIDGKAAVDFVAREKQMPRILIVGAGHQLYDAKHDITYTDVAFGGRVNCICDGQGLPFAAERFDLVIAVAVLEHVTDPYQCMAEIQRVLKPDGLIYSATPFLQPVHMGAYDFTRFTPLGHRRLHRYFDEIESGIAQGPGSVLGLSIRYFLLSFSDNGRYRRLARAASMILTLPLRWSDVLFRNRKGAWDVAGGSRFFGRKRATPVPDREILLQYRGRDSAA
ncbi:MAG: methyltransferase domain-containing protein [Acetobacteraceae bacterium]